jgi:SAM-dependent methyltransferase
MPNSNAVRASTARWISEPRRGVERRVNGQRAFGRIDAAPDLLFYREPRFVEHIDDGAIAAVTQLYRERFAGGGTVLDLMSSWVSHLPPEIAYAGVTGLGMNAAELARNPRLTARIVHDLNAEPRLPLASAAFDAAGMCVSIQYLTRPVEVLADTARVLRPGAPLVVTFSNRCFPTKAVAIWRMLDARGHAALVANYLRDAGGWDDIAAFDRSPGRGDPLYAVVARRKAADEPAVMP